MSRIGRVLRDRGVQRRIGAGEQKAHVARAFGISRETLYQYLRAL